MPLMQWDKVMSVGIPAIDEQHQKLIDIINELYDGMMDNRSRLALGSVLIKLEAYMAEHFKYEEDLFAATEYPLSKEHTKEHNNFIVTIKAFIKNYNETITGVASIDALSFLKKWLISHIMGEDKKYADHFKAAGVR